MGSWKNLICIVFFASLWPVIAIADTTCQLPAYAATYDVNAYGLNVGTTLQKLMISPDQTYKIILDSQSTIALYQDHILQMSTGEIINSQLVPRLFDSHQDHKNKNERIDFDWKNHVAHSDKSDQDKEESKDLVLHPGTGDLLSTQILLRQLLIKNPDQKKLSYELIKSNKFQTYQFTVVGTELTVLKTVLGDIKTIQLERTEGPRVDDYWLAPNYGYLLVKSTQTKNGALQVTLVLKTYQAEKICLE